MTPGLETFSSSARAGATAVVSNTDTARAGNHCPAVRMRFTGLMRFFIVCPFFVDVVRQVFVVLVFDRFEPMRNPEPKAQIDLSKEFASIVLPVEFAGSSRQTKFGDEKYHGRQKSLLNCGLLLWSLSRQHPVLAERTQRAGIGDELERRSLPADFQLNSISFGAPCKERQIQGANHRLGSVTG